jgi:predicted chitinase
MPGITPPWCVYRSGPNWIDKGTSALTRFRPPGPLGSAKEDMPATYLLSLTEQRILASLDLAGIGDLHERAMFLAQLSVESSGFLNLRENLNYSARRLQDIFPTRFRSEADASSVAARGPGAVADRLYGDHPGNPQPGDAERFIGRGYIQLTTRDNYTRAGRALNLDLVNHPELAEDPGNAVLIALWYWHTRNIGPSARAADVTRVTLLINGGLNALAERRECFRHYAKMLAALFPWRSRGLQGWRP